MGHVPESLPVTEETKELLRQQANPLPEPTVLRLIDLLAVAVEDLRQGGDPRLPLELALVKVTRPHADLSRESLAHRVELLKSRISAGAQPSTRATATVGETAAPEPSSSGSGEPEARPVELEQVADAWHDRGDRSRALDTRCELLAEAVPTELSGDTLTLEFPAGNDFHRRQISEPQNIGLLRDALYEVMGRRLAVVLEAGVAEAGIEEEDDQPGEERFISLLQETLDAREVEEKRSSVTSSGSRGRWNTKV